MKKKKAEEGKVLPEYDFSKAVRNPYAEKANAKSNLVVIDPELQDMFPDSESVNQALRVIVKASAKVVKARTERLAKAS